MLKNLVGLVTGGASGLGKAAAKTLINQGCKITICDLPSSPGLEVATTLGPDASFAPADIRSPEEMECTFADVVRRFKKIDFVVNCAGISCAHKVYSVTTAKCVSFKKVRRVIETNVLGMINVTRIAASYISQNTPDSDGCTGVIVNAAGVEAFDGQVGQVIISATSGAIVSMTQPLARDFSDIGIRVACICVGLIDSPLINSLPSSVKVHMSQSCALPKRFGTSEEFGHTVKFVLENRYINGCVIRLDAGLRHVFA